MPYVIKCLKIVYTKLYTDNYYLRQFDNNIKNLKIKTLGEIYFNKKYTNNQCPASGLGKICAFQR
jgi:hypothetical protein